jgi:hypothetical protein
MRRIFVSFGLGALALLLFTLGAPMAADPPDAVIIDDCAKKKSAVEFPHKAHVELTKCATCHHTQEGLTADSGDEVKPCASCHFNPEVEGTPDCSEMSTTKNPYHATCIKCHKDAVKKDEASKAPTKCDGCHPKAG